MEKETGSLSDSLVWGYAVNLTLAFLASLMPMSLAGVQEISREEYQLALTTGFVGMFALVAFKDCLAPSLLWARSIICTSLLLVGGCVFSAASVFVVPLDTQVVLLDAFFIGAGCALSFIIWHRMFAIGHVRTDVRKKVVLGTALGSIVGLILFLLGTSLHIVAFSVGSCLDIVFLVVAYKTMDVPGSSTEAVFSKPQRRDIAGCIRSMWRPALCTGVIGFASRVLQVLANEVGEDISLSLAVAMLCSAVFMGILYWKRDSFPFRALYGVLSVLVALAFLPLSLMPVGALPVVTAIAFFCFSIVSMNMVITTIETARMRKVHPSVVFGFFAACVYLITDAGPVIVESTGQILGLSQFLVASMMVVYLVSLVGLLLGHAKDEKNSSIEPLEEMREPSRDLSRSFLVPVVVDRDFIPICCDELAKRYRLTAREKEVLELMARGRSLAHISETMYVSLNTVRSHCRNLYRKLDVHSKQEALDMLEQTRKAYIADNARLEG